MKIILAKNTGFCWGVKRAMELAQQMAHQTAKKIYTYGPLIHNQEAVEMLARQGILPYDRRKHPSGVIIIRAHGLPPATRLRLEKQGYEIVDATCPHVKVSEKKAAVYAKKGYQVIIVGDKKHAEVISLVGYARAGNPLIKPILISSAREVQGLKIRGKRPLAIIAQSTFQEEEYQQIVNAIRNRAPKVVTLNTICRVTTQRQQEVKEMARKVDAMMVVGSHHSANTSRLATLARSMGIPIFHIARPAEIMLNQIRPYQTIGVTAGTSTPEWITEAVLKRLTQN